MIKLHKQETLEWYKLRIMRLLVSKTTNEKNIEKEYEKYQKKVNKELKDLGIIYTLDEILLGEFSLLKSIAKKKYDFTNCKNIQNLKTTYKNRFTQDNLNNLLVKKLGITTCPYCNRDFINNRTAEKSQAQIDHFFSKTEYPIFSLSFYNLIPSCYSCNHIKNTSPITISPYDDTYDFINGYKITYEPLSSDFLDKSDLIKVLFKYKDNRIEDNIVTMKIHEAYKLHNDYVRELLMKSFIYTPSYLNNLMEEYQDLFSSYDDMIRVLFGNYITSEELGKRPLAKMTRDILYENSEAVSFFLNDDTNM